MLPIHARLPPPPPPPPPHSLPFSPPFYSTPPQLVGSSSAANRSMIGRTTGSVLLSEAFFFFLLSPSPFTFTHGRTRQTRKDLIAACGGLALTPSPMVRLRGGRGNTTGYYYCSCRAFCSSYIHIHIQQTKVHTIVHTIRSTASLLLAASRETLSSCQCLGPPHPATH